MNDDICSTGDPPEKTPLGIAGSLADAAEQVVTEAESLFAEVLAPWEVSLADCPDVASVRRRVRGHLAVALHPDVLVDLLMVVGELVANSYLHTDSPRRLRLTRDTGGVRIEVSDGDPAPPVLCAPSTTRRVGRGILLVDQLCLGWGVLPDTGAGGVPGKIVWAVLSERTA